MFRCTFFLFVMAQIMGWTLKSTRWKYRTLQLKSWGSSRFMALGFWFLEIISVDSVSL